MGKNQWKVCVHCNTYNQSQYVKDALNGFVMQQLEFPFVAVIIDDASTDGEQQVLMNYLSEHFEKCELSPEYDREDDEASIHFARHKENKNCYFAVVLLKYNHYSQRLSKQHIFDIWQKDSEYVAICEGDDYWIDPLKLQKQVDFLDDNSEYGMCYTKVMRYHQAEECIQDIWGGDHERFEQMITKNTVPTLTALLRYDILLKYLKTAYRDSGWLMGDYPMWLWFAAESKIKFIDEITATYRILPESASHSLLLKKTWRFANSFFCIQKYYIHAYQNILSDDCVQAVYCKAYRGLLPAAVALGNVDFVKEAGLFMKYNNLPPVVTIIYKFRHIFKPILVMWYRLKGLRL